MWAMSDFVENSVDNVKHTIIEGALLTVLIVFLFLGSWRSTVITGLTLPISVISTFIFLYALGFTLNYMTLMALSLCIGLLIDDAIVVRENIVRHIHLGKDHYAAAREGTRRDRAGGAGDDAVDRRGVRADRVHGRHRRQVLLSVRHHRRGGRAGVAVRQLHAGPDAVGRVARPAGRRARAAAGRADTAALRTPDGPRAPHLRSVAASGTLAPQDHARDRGGEFCHCDPDRRCGRHRNDAGVGPELYVGAADDAGGFEPRLRQRARQAGRGGAAGVQGDRRDRHRHRGRGHAQHRGDEPEARAAQRAQAGAEGPRAGDPATRRQHSRRRAQGRLEPADLRRAARQQRSRDEPRDHRPQEQGAADPRRHRYRDLGQGRHAGAFGATEARARRRVRHHVRAARHDAARDGRWRELRATGSRRTARTTR